MDFISIVNNYPWTFIQTLASIVFGIVGVIIQILQLRKPRNPKGMYPSETPQNQLSALASHRTFWGFAGFGAIAVTIFVLVWNNSMKSPNEITLAGFLCATLCFMAAFRPPNHPQLLAVLVSGQLGMMVYAFIHEYLFGGDYEMLNSLPALLLISVPALLSMFAIIVALVQAGRGGRFGWFAFTLGATLGSLAISLVLDIPTLEGNDSISLSVAVAILLTSLGSEV